MLLPVASAPNNAALPTAREREEAGLRYGQPQKGTVREGGAGPGNGASPAEVLNSCHIWMSGVRPSRPVLLVRPDSGRESGNFANVCFRPQSQEGVEEKWT